MKAVLKQFFKIFLFSGFSMAILLLLIDGLPIDPKLFVLKFVAFGGVMGLVLTFFHFQSLKGSGQDTSNFENFKASQIRITESPKSLDEIYERIQSDAYFKKMQLDKNVDSIEMKSKISWKSFGELITIEMESVDASTNRFSIKSRPLLGTTLVDYGRGLEIVKRLETLILEA